MRKTIVSVILGTLLLSTTAYAASPVTLSPQEQNVQKEILKQLKIQNEKLDEVVKELKKSNQAQEQRSHLEKA
ncbi:hypothetical protein ACTOJ1_000572 [Shigella flexneri]